MKKYKNLLVVFAITAMVAWALGVLRFEYDWIYLLYKILLFPFGFLYMIYESYCMAMFSSVHVLNDEFFQLGMFTLSIIGQSIIYYVIYKYIKSLVNRIKINKYDTNHS
jgi:hypothetical protein